jgi:uncharacterized protein (TIGR00297 family)
VRSAARYVTGLAAAACVAAIAERRGSLSSGGAVAATLVGTLAFGSGWPATRGLLAFFFTSTLLSHLPRNGVLASPKRSAGQVLANGGVASAAWAVRLLGGPSQLDYLAIGSLTAAAADTWATEIGQRWGGAPRLITSGHPVDPGESGGVTRVGTAAAMVGALVVAVAGGQPRAVPAMTTSGLLGALLDSLLGATVQARYVCRVCGAHTERSLHCQEPASLASGFAWMTNDTVNGLATLVGGSLSMVAGPTQGPP